MKRLLLCTFTLALMLFALASCFGENHVYSGPCDPSCNECDRVTREPEVDHTFADCSDTECDVCGEVREAVEHTYKSACSAKCEACGYAREDAAAHIYDSPCDAECNVCGEAREASEHIYANNCDTDCNFCGALRVTNHTYTNACDKTCNVCGATRIPEAHTYSNACDSTCDVCGELRMVPNHVYSTVCDADCNVCGELRIASAHTYDHACDGDCNVCGATRVVADHVYDNACDAECNTCQTVRSNIHDFGDWRIKSAADCDNAAVEVKYCALCGEEVTREGEAALGHVFDNTCDTACNRAKCDYKRTITHSYSEEYATKIPATCTTAEKLNRFCDICGYEDIIAGKGALNHDFDHACDTDCNREDCDYTRVIVHVFGEWETKIPAKCLDDEIEHRICGICNAEETRIGDVAALGHAFDHDCDTVCNREDCGYTREIEHQYDDNCDAVCNVVGCGFERIPPHTYDSITDLECNDCGYDRECTGHIAWEKDCLICWVCGAAIPGAEHIFGEWETETAANCFAPEVEARYCTICNVKETQIGDSIREHAYSFVCDEECDYDDCDYVRAVEHTFDDVCDTDCNVPECDFVRTVPHVFEDNWATKTPANCTDAEVEVRYCTVCQAEETRFGDEALDHEYSDPCDKVCDRKDCGYERTTAHEYGEWMTKTPANCYDAEVLYQICTLCSAENEETKPGQPALDHAWTDSCDAICNRDCGFERTPPHSYDDEHDVTCNNCDYVRPCNGHAPLATDCTKCKYCEEAIPGSTHSYIYICDTACSVCGTAITGEAHKGSAADCTICMYCNKPIEGAAHIATAEDCTVCQNCDAGTGKNHVADPTNCTHCANCDQASDKDHVDGVTDCTKCEDCGIYLSKAHTDANGDSKCDTCGKETLPGENWFPWAPL